MKSRHAFSIAAAFTMALSLTTTVHASLTVQDLWHLGESGGNLPTDSVGGKNFTGQVGTQVVSTTVYAPGSTASLYYNGWGGTYMASPSDGPTVPADNWVLEMWVNPDTYDGGANLASLGSPTDGVTGGWAKIGLSGSGDVYFARENQSFGPLYSKITLHAWNEIAYVQTGGKIYGYVNGVQAGAYDNNDASINNNGALHLGVKPGNSDWYTGYIGDVRFSTFAPGAFNTKDLLYFQAVPEPTSLAALAFGAVILFRRRRS